MTYNVFGGTLSLSQSINQSTKIIKVACDMRLYFLVQCPAAFLGDTVTSINAYE